jgi:hypothetical protein
MEMVRVVRLCRVGGSYMVAVPPQWLAELRKHPEVRQDTLRWTEIQGSEDKIALGAIKANPEEAPSS